MLAILHSWPLARHPERYSRNDNGDAQLNEYGPGVDRTSVAVAIPLQLFEANIFYPAHDALAFSEPLIVPALMGAPLAWLGCSPVLVYNLVLMAGFALTALATALLMEAWTGDLLAGLLAGSIFAFNTHTLTRLAHVQGIHIYGLPLALLCTDRLLLGSGYSAAFALAGCMALLAYTSGYLLIFGVVMVAIALLVRLPDWRGRWRQTLAGFAVATAGAGLLCCRWRSPTSGSRATSTWCDRWISSRTTPPR